MNCQDIQREEIIERYLNDRLEPALQDELETHILSCPMCAESLELLLAVRTGLEQRAHEIRQHTPGWHFPFRWQVAVSGLGVLLLVGIGVFELRKGKTEFPRTAGQSPVSPVEQPNQTLELSPQRPNQTQSAGQTMQASPTRKGSRHPPLEAKAREKSLALQSAPPLEELSVRNQPPTLQGGPPEGGNANEVATTVKPKDSGAGAQPTLTTEQGIELYRIGAVEAPPYTFSGLSSAGKIPGDGKTSTFSSAGRNADSHRPLFQRAMNAYVLGHYDEAAGILETAAQQEPGAADVTFYLGICRLLKGQPERAVVPLQSAIAAGKSPYLQASHYFLAKAYVQSGRLKEADKEFEEAAATPGRLTTDAKALLSRLRTLRPQIEKQ